MRIIKTVDKLILKAYLGPMLASFFIVMFVLMMNFVWRYIDELVGKGLSAGVIIELLFYATNNMISLGFPLATLFAAIMTMGNLGENYELLALKSAGVSLPRIILSLFVVTMGMSAASFFVGNNLVPYSNRKMSSIIYDIRQQKQDIEFKDGLFFNGIDNVSIRVEKQDPKTHLLTDILLYNTEVDAGQRAGNMTVIAADSGYIHLSSDKRFIVMDFWGGTNYQFTRDRNWFDDNTFQRTSFAEQHIMTKAPGYDFSRTDESLFSGASTKNVAQLGVDIDSLNRTVTSLATDTYGPLLHDFVFAKDTMVVSSSPEAALSLTARHADLLLDSLPALSLQQTSRLYSDAERLAKNSRSAVTYDESVAKDVLNQLYRSQIEWQTKWALPIAVIVFFLIGAPLGAIIRKGGLGMPIVISVAFFVLYYVLKIMGEKLAREGTWSALAGVWLPTMVLLPIAIYLTYKATNDSNLLNVEWYIIKYNQLKTKLINAKRKTSK
ncbi:MAG: LptF/LptG family permease [Rikenellaceae bacterium]|jgi:lipopolysaccharide export system permease protein|nr:LptF/LptG family permease [Rikenellaceae bacterium]